MDVVVFSVTSLERGNLLGLVNQSNILPPKMPFRTTRTLSIYLFANPAKTTAGLTIVASVGVAIGFPLHIAYSRIPKDLDLDLFSTYCYRVVPNPMVVGRTAMSGRKIDEHRSSQFS